MRLIVLLLFISTVCVVCASWDDVQFPVDVLQDDLSAIEGYYNNIDEHIHAYIHWPKEIVFHVQRREINNEKYLEIAGNFQMRMKNHLDKRPEYKDLLFKDGIFYVQSIGTNDLMTIPHTARVHYTQEEKPIQKGDTFLSIQYKSIDEVEKAVKPIYTNNEVYFRSYFEKSPVTYLATWTEPTPNFLEFGPCSNYEIDVEVVDISVLALIGKVENKNVILSRTGVSPRLVLDQTAPRVPVVVITDTLLDLRLPPVATENVFGVRMMDTGFLTEVRENKIKMLSTLDLDYNESPAGHRIFAKKLLGKTKTVEPISCDSNDETCKQLRPEIGKFQVYGHFLTKKINYLEDGVSINEECPFVIEYEQDGANFVFGTTETKQICTDDKHLWMENFNGDATNNSDEQVTLLFPNECNPDCPEQINTFFV